MTLNQVGADDLGVLLDHVERVNGYLACNLPDNRLCNADDTRERSAVVLAAADLAPPYGAALPWPPRTGEVRHRPGRTAGARGAGGRRGHAVHRARCAAAALVHR